ncbi:tetratricopeptide repeat protein [Crocinitomix catalasitica]|nr:tetratricopeptide repeat protein [Crocinitomix catalasitica]
MRKLLVIFIFIPLVSFGQLSKEQKAQIDSLKLVIKTSKHDTVTINAWKAWDNIIWVSDPELDFELNNKIEELSRKNLKTAVTKKEKLFYLKSRGSALNVIGIYYERRGSYDKAISYYNRSLKVRKRIGDKEGVANCLNNIGIIYRNQGDFASAIYYYTRSLAIQEELGDKKGIAACLGNIGLIYKAQGDYAKAIDYCTGCLTIGEEIGDKRIISTSLNNIAIIYLEYGNYNNAFDYQTRSLIIREEMGDKHGIAMSLANIGDIYMAQDNYASAIDNYYSSLSINKEIGYKPGIASSLDDIGTIYQEQGDYDSAIHYYTSSLAINEEIGDKMGIATSLNYVGVIYVNQGQAVSKSSQREALFKKAMSCGNRALSIAQEIGHVMHTKEAARVLYNSFKATSNYKKALEMHELYITMRDSISSEENQKEVIRHQYKYEYEKQALADSVTHAKEAQIKDVMLDKKQAQLKSEQTQRYALYWGLGLVGCLAFVLLRGFQRKKRDNVVISLQKEEVESHRKNILDSINYAEKIQRSLLPDDGDIRKFLPGFSSLYLPKDIVSGDFYWFTHLKDISYLVLSDCTGHGVPGAFMSMMGSTLLRDIIIGSGIENPAAILEHLDSSVRELLGQNDLDSSEDGMEMALVKIDHQNDKLTYAGAGQHLYLIRGEVEIIKSDIRSIGGWVKHRSRLPEFTNKEFELNKIKAFYLSSDGLEDQFNEGRIQKFGRSRFVKLISSYHDKLNLNDLESEFNKWKGDQDQIDDVCVIAVRV